MSTGTYGATSIDLSGRVTLDAISNDNLDLEGNAGADVNITGAKDITTSSSGVLDISGANDTGKLIVKDNGGGTIFQVDTTNGYWSTGTNRIGGHAVSYHCERNTSATSGTWYSWGNGANSSGIGPIAPVAGKIRYVTLTAITSSTCTVAVGINGVASAATVSLSSSTANTATANVSFSAGDRLGATVTSGTATNGSTVNFFIIWD